MKKICTLLLAVALILPLSACSAETKYSMSFFGTFDTIIQIIGYAKDQQTFDRVADQAQALFTRYHQVYDAYNRYDGVNNLRYINEEAAKGPVRVEPELLELLLYCKEKQPTLRDTVNIALGAVLQIWHAHHEEAELYPEKASVPAIEALQAASGHINFDDVIIDAESGTVYYSDPELQLDLGAVAKGYAAECVAEWMLSSEMPSFILSAGGNVRAGEKPLDGRDNWVVSIQNPDGMPYVFSTSSADILEKLLVKETSVVTSGDYQRYYMVDGVRYHHIISPQTLMPARGMRAVTIVTEDSGWADLLSTVFFVLPYAEGAQFAAELPGVEVFWVLEDGSIEMTDGMRAMLVSTAADTTGK